MSRSLLFALTFAMATSLVIGIWAGFNVAIVRVNDIGLIAACENQALPIIRCESLGHREPQP